MSISSFRVIVVGWVVLGNVCQCEAGLKVHKVDKHCINESLCRVKLTFDRMTLFSAHIPYWHFICLKQD